MKINSRVMKIIDEQDIRLDELLMMIERAAISSRPGGNRQFHNWLFTIEADEVLSMKSSEPVYTGTDTGKGYMHEEHTSCQGWGCKKCGYWGEVRRYVNQ